LISQRTPNISTNYFISDGHGSTRMLADIGGTVINVMVYDSYGNLIASNRVLQTTYLYSGQQFDSDLGLYLNRARYLNTGTGRFWTMDGDHGNNEAPPSLHKYLYCGDDPANGIDPSGHDLIQLELELAIEVTIVEVETVEAVEEVGVAAEGVEAAESAEGVEAAEEAEQLELDFNPRFQTIYNRAPNGFSNVRIGQQMHDDFEGALESKFPKTDGNWEMRTDPGQRGVDATYIGDPTRNPGFNYAELKPYTKASIDKFFDQIQNWNLPPGETALFFYDSSGDIWWSGYLF
jgi:RHS repeat-associated protein